MFVLYKLILFTYLIMETKKQNRNWFTWHVLPTPKDYPIQSVVEFVVLLISLVALLFVYGRVNHVNVIDAEFDIAYLDGVREMLNSGDFKDNSSKSVDIDYFLPMTDVTDLKEREEHLDKSGLGESMMKSRGYIIPQDKLQEKEKNDKPNLNVTVVNFSEFANIAPRKNGLRWQNFEKKDSIIRNNDSLITSLYPDVADDLKRYSYFHRHKIKLRSGVVPHYNFTPIDTSNVFVGKKGCTITNCYNKEGYAFMEQFKSGEGFGLGTTFNFTNVAELRLLGIPMYKYNPIIGDPGWFAMEDVSQTYFKFKLNTFDIDSLSLKIDFVGATEFLEMQPKPDETGMSYIKFTDLEKIRQIQENGLLFHAQFRELENRQSVRIFFLTALLSVNVISLIVFVFFASYKMIYAWRDKRVERKAKTKKEDGNVKQ